MKKSSGLKTMMALVATLFVASTSFVGCVSTDDGETLDPAVVASSEAAPNNLSASENVAAGASENVANSNLASTEEDGASAEAALNVASSADNVAALQDAAVSNTGEQPSVDVASDAEATNSQSASLTNAIAAPANEASGSDPFAPATANASAEPAANSAVAAAQADQPAQATQTDQADQPAPAEQPAQADQAVQATTVVGALPEEGSMVPYHVRKGDTLAKIAGRIFGSAARWQELAEQNNIVNPNLIYAGDVLLYRMDAKAKEFAAKQDSATKKVVKVASGESLWSIAEREFGNAAAWRVIWKDNPTIKNPDVIHAGMQLVVTNWMHVAQGDH